MRPAFEENAIIELLMRHNMSVTRNRLLVLSILLQHASAMSVSIIQRYSATTLDRVSIYRTLQKLLAYKLVHSVPNSSGEVKYILKKAEPGVSPQQAPITYFICTCCGHTAALKKPRIDNLVLPELASVLNFHLIIEGFCGCCR